MAEMWPARNFPRNQAFKLRPTPVMVRAKCHFQGIVMADLLTVENLGNLLMLCFLQAVLGFDNLLYISIESQRAPVAQQAAVRRWGIILAVILRVILLFTMIQLIDAMAEPFYIFPEGGFIEGGVNFATVVFISM